MKNYEEITNSLLARRERYITEEKAKKRRIVTLAASLSCFCLIALVGVGLFNSDLFNSIPTVESESKVSSSETYNNLIVSYPQSTVGTNSGSISQSSGDLNSGIEHTDNPCIFTLETWFNNKSVVWKDGDIQKGNSLTGLTVELGSTLIDDELTAEFAKNNDSTVYAVMVDFSSMIPDDLIYEGKTLTDWAKELQRLVSQGLNTEAKQIAQKISTAKEQFYFSQLNKFRDKFEKKGLGVYHEKYGTTIDNCVFYTFGTKEQIESIKCNPDEAFIFSLAVRFK